MGAPQADEGAVYDSVGNCYLKPDAFAKRNFGFLFLASLCLYSPPFPEGRRRL